MELANNATLRKYQELQKHLSQITIFHKSALGDEEKAQLKESIVHTKLGCWMGEGITLRARKGNHGETSGPVESWNFVTTD